MKKDMWKCLVLIFVVGFIGYGIGADTQSSDSPSTMVTHIEYNPFGLMKVEIPKIEAPWRAESSEKSQGKNASKYFFFLFPVHVEKIDIMPYNVTQVSFLKIPFAQNIRYKNAFDYIRSRSDADENPLNNGNLIDKSFFCLLSGFWATYSPDSAKASSQDVSRIKRVKILDMFLLSFIKYDEWGKNEFGHNNHYLELLDVPFVTSFRRNKFTKSDDWTVLKVPFCVGYKSRNEETKSSSVLLHVPFVSLYGSDKNNVGRNDWIVADATLLSLIKNRESKDKKTLSFISTPFLGTDWLTFAVWRDITSKDAKTYEFFRIPLIGPLFKYTKDNDNEYSTSIFPGPRSK